jgi:WD40 repeat protein
MKSLQSLAVSPTGELLVTGSFQGQLIVYDTRDGIQRRALSDQKSAKDAAHLADINSCLWVQNTNESSPLMLLSAGSDMFVKLWEVAEGRLLKTLGGHKGAVLNLAAADGGNSFLSASRDGTVCRWSIESQQNTGGGGEVVMRFNESVTRVATAASGLIVAGSSGGSIKAVTAQSPAVAFEFETFQLQSVDSLCLMSDINLLAYGGAGGLIEWRDMRMINRPFMRAQRNQAAICDLSAQSSAEGNRLLACSGVCACFYVNNLLILIN